MSDIYDAKLTSHGNYKCPFCNHKVWKTSGPASDHIKENHPVEAATLSARLELETVRVKNVRLENELRELKKPKPTVKYYDAYYYCSNCLKIWQGGMPKGSIVKDVPCAECATRNLHLVTNVQWLTTK